MLEKFGLTPINQHRRVLTFAIGASAKLSDPPKQPFEIPMDGIGTPDPKAEKAGYSLYASRCAVCHGMRAVAVGPAPDLRASAVVRSSEAFSSVLRDGVLTANGMPRFDELSDEEREQMRKYILAQARASLRDDRQ
jgi:quinohemoprotein ethanol dehydrogenase